MCRVSESLLQVVEENGLLKSLSTKLGSVWCLNPQHIEQKCSTFFWSRIQIIPILGGLIYSTTIFGTNNGMKTVGGSTPPNISKSFLDAGKRSFNFQQLSNTQILQLQQLQLQLVKALPDSVKINREPHL